MEVNILKTVAKIICFFFIFYYSSVVPVSYTHLVVFQHYEDRILICYTLLDAHSSTTLRFKPFLAFRSVRQFTHENATASRAYDEVPNGIKTCMYAGYPDLYMQFSKKNEFVFQPDWYRGVEYPKEQERGYASNEDLYVPGYFEMGITKGESVVLSLIHIYLTLLETLFKGVIHILQRP